MKKRIITAIMLASLGITTAACNTVKGLGRDIQSVGEAGEKAIDR